jgi:IS5 family transposase
MMALRASECERVIVDTTAPEKAIAHPVDSRLLEVARGKVVEAAKAAGISLKQTVAKEGKALRWRASGHVHAKQFGRGKRALKRQRTILGIVLREIGRKRPEATLENLTRTSHLDSLLARAKRIAASSPRTSSTPCMRRKQSASAKPERYEFGVKVGIAVTHKQGLIVGARAYPGNPYDGHILREQLEQVSVLLEDVGVKPKQAVVDLGFRGVDGDNPSVEILHRGKTIGHLEAEHRMERCWLSGATGDALHAVLCAVDYNLRWLMRAVVRLGLTGLFALWVLFVRLAKFRQRLLVG